MGHQRLDILQGHALLNGPLHTDQPHPVLIFHQFANGPNPTITQVIDVVNSSLAVFETDQVLDRFNDVFFGQCPLRNVHIEAKSGIDLIATNLGKIIKFGIEKQVLKEVLRDLRSRRTRRPKPAVDFQEGVLG